MDYDDASRPQDVNVQDAQDNAFDPYAGEEENQGGDDIEKNTEEQEPDEAEEQNENSQDQEEREKSDEADDVKSDPEYQVWRPNDPIHQGPPYQHAIITCSTTAGPLLMHFHRAWSPHGYERATSLFERHYYDQSHFFRVVPHFLVQFGIGYTKDEELRQFSQSTIPDDPKRSDLLPFKEGMISFAGSGPNSRSSQLFIAYDKAQSLGTSPWETPFGEVMGKDSFDTVRKFYQGYGDMPPWGKGPQQGPIHNRGSRYIEENFPLLDKFNTCQVKRVLEMPKEKEEEAPVTSMSSVRKGGVKVDQAKSTSPLNDTLSKKGQFPVIKLLLFLGAAAVVILGLGLRRRRKKKVGKSV
ncbi:hypothetical protein ACHAWX_001640 [Stephanocyclus meneghinianus]